MDLILFLIAAILGGVIGYVGESAGWSLLMIAAVALLVGAILGVLAF